MHVFRHGRVLVGASALAALFLSVPSMALAQAAVSLSGRLLNSLSGDPIPNATVVVDELRREATSDAAGVFTFIGVPPGDYHVSVRAEGYSSRRTEVRVAAAGVPVDVLVDPELHFEEVLSVGPEARSQFDAFQATSVLAGQELTKQLESSLGETLRNQPGVAVRGMGASSARPVVRGLDGDRVLILQDGQRTGDLSSQSADHGVTVNPAAAKRIEVVRGPATLLYGANAIGGLVNVITDEIPESPQTGASGNVTADVGSSGGQAGTAADLHLGNGTLALHVGGGGRRSGNVGTPLGEVVNSQSRTAFGNVGLAWTGDKGYFGGSYGIDDTRFGIPVVEEGQVELTPRKHAFTLRTGAQGLESAFDAFRATLAHRRYQHDELEGGDVGTTLINNTTELQVMGSHRAVARVKGSVGGWFLDRDFDARGAEALSPAVGQRGFAGFLYEEVRWPHVTFQFGARVDHTNYAPFGEPERSFTNPSGSLGLLLRPSAANESITLAVSLAHAARTPALEELFYFGPHHGNMAFEVGNPDLASERALGVDVSLRWRARRASGEVTYFRNTISDYIFARPLDEGAFEAREDEFASRFRGRRISHDEHGHGAEEAPLPFLEYVGADSVLQGLEAHADVQITAGLSVESGLDYVRGTLSATDTPLPRMPPMRVRAGLRYQRNAFQAGFEANGVTRQGRVFDRETETAGYGLLKLFASYSLQSGRAVHTFTARVDNATNELYRNHLSLIKELVPEVGRSAKLVYGLTF